MRSTLVLFTLLASSILAVSSKPVPEVTRAVGTSSENSGSPVVLSTRESKPYIVTLIDKNGQDLIHSKLELWQRTSLTRNIFARGFGDKAKLPPKYIGTYIPDSSDYEPKKSEVSRRNWFYFKVEGYKKCDPCFGWIASSCTFQVLEGSNEATRNHLFGRQYVGISPGKPRHMGFKGKQGKPVFRKEHKGDSKRQVNARLVIVKMQEEWENLVKEFNKRFMPPVDWMDMLDYDSDSTH